MNELLGNAIVIAVLAVIAGLAVRSLWRDRDSRCGGDCSRCGKCGPKK